MNEPLLSYLQQAIFMHSDFRGKPGYAITEVLVATVVLSIGFIGLTNAYSNISSVANQAVAMTKAGNLAHATMERIMSQNFDARGNEANGKALNFDGTDDYIDTGNSFQTTFNGSFTISCWVKLADGNPPQNKVVFGTVNSSGEDRVTLEVKTDGNIIFRYESDNNNNSVTTSSTVFSDGPTAWTHVALVAPGTGSNQLIYINGKSVAHTGGTIPEMSTWESSDELFIGAGNNAGTAESHFAGYIDEFRIWNVVRTADDILDNHKRSISDPYKKDTLDLYLRMNNGSGSIAFDHSSSMAHGNLINMDDEDWVTGYSTSLGREGETTWSGNDDVDDFHAVSFEDSDYTGLDNNPASNNFSGLGGQVYVKYVSLNTGTAGTIEDPYTFVDSAEPTDYKQITVKVGIPGTTDSTQIDAIKSAKVGQGLSLIHI